MGEAVYKEKLFVELWLDDPKIRKYDNYIFKPYPLKLEKYEYSTYEQTFKLLKPNMKNY